jgi:hypothetical protein
LKDNKKERMNMGEQHSRLSAALNPKATAPKWAKKTKSQAKWET